VEFVLMRAAVSRSVPLSARRMRVEVGSAPLLHRSAAFGAHRGRPTDLTDRGLLYACFTGRHAFDESLTVGVGMVPRGEVGLITANIGWAAGVVSAGTYSLAVLVVLVTTLVTPGALQMLFSGQPHAPPVLPSVVAAEVEPHP
jgi:hypothetical protein